MTWIMFSCIYNIYYYLGMSQRANIWNLNSHVFKDFVESEIRQRITYLKTIGKADLKKALPHEEICRNEIETV